MTMSTPTLRDLTKNAHDKAENTPFMRLLIAKAIKVEEYQLYVTQMALIYAALEPVAEKAGLFADLQGIQRLPNIRKDLAELNTLVGTPAEIINSTVFYYNEIRKLKDPQKIMAHVYVRYAGDLYGGQMLKPLSPGSGLWYDFGSNLPTLRQNMRALCTSNLAEEANIAFDRTTNIVEDILFRTLFT